MGFTPVPGEANTSLATPAAPLSMAASSFALAARRKAPNCTRYGVDIDATGAIGSPLLACPSPHY